MMQAAGIVIVADDGAVLMLQRPDGSWCMPGGKAEDGETSAFAAIRETFEETGISITQSELVPLAEIANPDGFVFACFAARRPRSDVTLSEESTAWVWADPNNLPQPLFMQSEALIALALNAPRVISAMDEKVLDINGWYEVTDNPISRVGVFPYSGKQIGPGLPEGTVQPDPDTIYAVLRPESELSRQETIDTFKLVPWIAGHTMLGEGQMAAEKKGIGGVVGEKVYYKDGILYGNLKMFSAGHAQMIQDGIKELSLGYRCTYEYAPGTYNGEAYQYVQRNIRGNHLASVVGGRMGELVAVRDSFTFDGAEKMADESKVENKVDITTLTLEEAVELVSKLNPLIAKLQEAAAGGGEVVNVEDDTTADNPNGAMSGDEDDKEAKAGDEDDEDDKEAKAGDEDDKPKGIAEDAMLKSVVASIARRDSLARNLHPVVGVFDHSAMTELQVAEYGCKKLGIKATGKEAVSMLKGYMLAANKANTSARTQRTTSAMDSASTGTVPAFLVSVLEK